MNDFLIGATWTLLCVVIGALLAVSALYIFLPDLHFGGGGDDGEDWPDVDPSLDPFLDEVWTE